MTPGTGSLTENHQRYLRVSCQHIDELLSGIEKILNESSSGTAFPRYASDITPAQRRMIGDYIARIRAQLVRVLDGQGISPEQPSVPATRSIRFLLVSVDIAIDELRPKHMKGFGELSAFTATDLNGIAGELRGLVSRLDRFLAGGEQDLGARLAELEQAGNDLGLLSRIERVVADRGLVEFRSAIAAILDRAEDRTFEIAVFGRVSSGKSSLLNAILGTAVLPVGVTPITAVPTRITFGDKPEITVTFADAPPQQFPPDRLAEFATEQQNPANKKQVTRITVALPAPRLKTGVAFVDTPGLGSLATSGAAETLAYLPKCDLGIVLIDAGSTLTEEDLRTILALQEAAVPVNVLLSKADLPGSGDLAKIVAYVKEHLASETGLALPVHPVSIHPSHRELLDRWFEAGILPLYDRSQELRTLSLQRKIGVLRDSVTSSLRVRISHGRQSLPVDPEQVRAVEARLRRATGQIAETRAASGRDVEAMAGTALEICSAAAADVLRAQEQDTGTGLTPGDIARSSILRSVQVPAGSLRESIEDLALQLEEDLVKSAAELGIADAPEPDEFPSLVRGMPVFDPGPVTVTVSRPFFPSVFGRGFAYGQNANRIRDRIGMQMDPPFAAYRKLLQEWTRTVIDQLATRFENYAERYRARAERTAGGGEMAPEERRAIEEDLKILAGRGPGDDPEKRAGPSPGTLPGTGDQ